MCVMKGLTVTTLGRRVRSVCMCEKEYEEEKVIEKLALRATKKF